MLKNQLADPKGQVDPKGAEENSDAKGTSECILTGYKSIRLCGDDEGSFGSEFVNYMLRISKTPDIWLRVKLEVDAIAQFHRLTSAEFAAAQEGGYGQTVRHREPGGEWKEERWNSVRRIGQHLCSASGNRLVDGQCFFVCFGDRIEEVATASEQRYLLSKKLATMNNAKVTLMSRNADARINGALQVFGKTHLVTSHRTADHNGVFGCTDGKLWANHVRIGNDVKAAFVSRLMDMLKGDGPYLSPCKVPFVLATRDQDLESTGISLPSSQICQVELLRRLRP